VSTARDESMGVFDGIAHRGRKSHLLLARRVACFTAKCVKGVIFGCYWMGVCIQSYRTC